MADTVARVLEAVDDRVDTLVARTAALVRVPSVSGTDAENEAQQELARQLVDDGYDVDHWRLDLAALANHQEFPGMEVDRREAWGLVARLPGTGDGPTLMFNGHIDVVPTGDARGVGRSAFHRRRARRPAPRPRRVRHEGRADGVDRGHGRGAGIGRGAARRRGGGVGAGRGGRRRRHVRPAPARVDGRRLRDRRADRARRDPGQLGCVDVPAARPRAGDPCRPAHGGCQRHRDVSGRCGRPWSTSSAAATRSSIP